MNDIFYLVSVNKFNYYCANEAAVEGCLARYDSALNNIHVTKYMPHGGNVAVGLEAFGYGRG